MRKLVWISIALLLLAGCSIMKSTQIEQAVAKALAVDQRTSSYSFEVSCDANGEVTITGEVYTPEDIDAVAEIASAVKGVNSVVNRCHVPDNDSGGLMQDGVVNSPFL